jgi:hypothetical protein
MTTNSYFEMIAPKAEQTTCRAPLLLLFPNRRNETSKPDRPAGTEAAV